MNNSNGEHQLIHLQVFDCLDYSNSSLHNIYPLILPICDSCLSQLGTMFPFSSPVILLLDLVKNI